MADFCKQCSEEHFGEDGKDLEGIGKRQGKVLQAGYGWPALCEGCGMTLVNEEGPCIDKHCMKHGRR